MRFDVLAISLAAFTLSSVGKQQHNTAHSKSVTAHSQNDETDKVFGQQTVHTSLTAGAAAQKACEALAKTFASSLSINNTFSHYYPEGSNPSLELLTASYPKGTIPERNLDMIPDILADVGPDIDITKESNYGQCRGRAARNGPLGGLPAFCRFGAFINTSPLTNVLAEVWLPLSSDPSLPLAKIDETDYPTNSTPITLSENGAYIKKPVWLDVALADAKNPTTKAKESRIKPAQDKEKDASVSDTNQVSADSEQSEVKPKPVAKRAARDIIKGEKLFGSSSGWNGRLASIMNGGQRGFVPLTDLKQTMCRYGFAVAGSNAGHFSTTGGVSWVNGTHREETMLDFGSRATHVTKILADEVIDTFYGKTAGVRAEKRTDAKGGKTHVRSYALGCSVGGGRVLSSAQVNPEDFDGLLAGAPTVGFNRMNQGQIHTQKIFRAADAGPGRFNLSTLGGPVRDVILAQCDKLDGVEDGVIAAPRLCKPKFEDDLLCGKKGAKYGGDRATCLTARQIANLKELYSATVVNDVDIYPRYLPGIEQRVTGFTGLASKAIGWTLLAFGLYPRLPPAKEFDGFNNITLDMIQLGQRLDTGGVNGENPDIAAFLNRGGKMISYHGLADGVVSPLATSQYYDDVLRVTGPKLQGKQVSDGWLHFEIPGMHHCRDGAGAWCIGSSTQNDAGNRPLKYDTKHDMILSLVAWAERSVQPTFQIGASYNQRSVVLPVRDGANITEAKRAPTVFRSYEYGLVNTRIHCPYPSYAAYTGGATTGKESWKSFTCKTK